MDSRVGQRVLSRAAAKMGSVEALATHLQLNRRLLMAYLTGDEPVPDVVFLQAIDLLLDEMPGVLLEPQGSQDPVRR